MRLGDHGSTYPLVGESYLMFILPQSHTWRRCPRGDLRRRASSGRGRRRAGRHRAESWNLATSLPTRTVPWEAAWARWTPAAGRAWSRCRPSYAGPLLIDGRQTVKI